MSAGSELEVKPNSIICSKLDDELNKRPLLFPHFSKFGNVIGINCSRANKYAIIHYSNPDEAKAAKESGGNLHPDFPPLEIFFSAKSPTHSGTVVTKKPMLKTNQTPTGRILRPRTGLSKLPTPLLKSPSKPLLSPKLLTKTTKIQTGGKSPIRLKRPDFGFSGPKKETISSIKQIDGWEEGEIRPFEDQDPIDFKNDPNPMDASDFSMGTFFNNPDKNVFKFALQKQTDESMKSIFGTGSMEPGISSSAGSPFTIKKVHTDTEMKPSLFEPQNLKNIEPRKHNFPTSSFQFKLPSSSPINKRSEGKMEKTLNSSAPSGHTLFSNPLTQVKIEEAQKLSEVTLSPSKKQSKPDMNIDQESITTNSELQDLLMKRSSTSEERYRILEARDKIVRMRNPKVKVRVELAVRLIGTCTDMCPEKERYMREAQRQLSIYEYIPGRDWEVDHNTAVKAYSRSSADQEEPLLHELRTCPALDLTINYMLHNIIGRCEFEDENLSEWYNFVWDRTRSIRKDITQQELYDLQAVSLMEKCARFHIFCSSRLCELDRHSFDPKLNDENLMKCLQSLEHMYADLQLKGTKCQNEPEFRSYQILMNLNEGDILWEIQQKDEWVFQSDEVKLALKIHSAIFDKNFVAFFRLVKKTSFMTACILHRYFYQVRLKALKAVIKAHSVPPKFEAAMNLSTIQYMLGYGPTMYNDFLSFCEDHGVTCDTVTKKLTVCKKQLQVPETPIVRRELELIDTKLKTSVSEAINGSPLGPNPKFSYSPKSSFDNDGYLIDRLTFQMPRKIVGERRSLPQNIPSVQVIQPQKLQPKALQVGPTRLTEESDMGRKRLTTFQSNFATVMSEGQKLGNEMIEQVARDKASELFEHFIDLEIREIGKGAIATSLYRKQIETERDLKITQNWMSSQTLIQIEQQVLNDLVRKICAKELSNSNVVNIISTAIETDICMSFLSKIVPEICLEALTGKKRDYDERFKKARDKLNRVILSFWFHIWKRNCRERKVEKHYLAKKRLRDIENFPPAIMLPVSPENILSSWLKCPAIESKVNKPHERSSLSDIVGVDCKLAPFIGVSDKEKMYLSEYIPKIVTSTECLSKTLPLTEDLEPQMAFPLLEDLLHTLLRDIFPKCISRISCPSSLFAAHKDFMKKVKNFLISNNYGKSTRDSVRRSIPERWHVLESVPPLSESQGLEILDNSFKLFDLPPHTKLHDAFHCSEEIGQEYTSELKDCVRQYIIELHQEGTSTLNLMNQLDDLLSTTNEWTHLSWKTLIQICQLYRLDCLESLMKNLKLPVRVALADLRSIKIPLTDKCILCTNRSGRKRSAERTTAETSTQFKNPRHQNSLNSVLNGLHDLIREVKHEKSIPSHSCFTSESENNDFQL